MSFDTKCFDLGEAFLEDEPSLNTEANRIVLAQLIQQTIEEFIDGARRDCEPPDPPGFEGGFADNH